MQGPAKEIDVKITVSYPALVNQFHSTPTNICKYIVDTQLCIFGNSESASEK